MPLYVHNNLLILTGCSIRGMKTQPVGTHPYNNPSQLQDDLEHKFYLLTRHLWYKGEYSIHDMHANNTDSTSYLEILLDKCLHIKEKEKKRNYLEAGIQQHQKFLSFVVSVEFHLWAEAESTLKQIAIHFTDKWRQPYSLMCGYVKIRSAITMVRAMYCYI